MRKKIIGFAISLAVLGLFALVFNLYFEIVEDEEYTLPSIEAMTNDFLALDRWLLSNGFTIRVENKGDYHVIADSFEDIIFIQSGNFAWDEESIAWLVRRAGYGATLIISLDFFRSWPEESALGEFLGSLGLESYYPEEGYSFLYDSNSPSFSRNISFAEPEDASLVLRDAEDYIRLVEFQKGRGRIIVTGRPSFMENHSIDHEPNARLCWYLFAGGGNNNTEYSAKTIFFIRGEIRPEGILGSFFQRGNFLIIIIACLLLIAAGFWAALPVFGMVRGSEEGKGRTLYERFLAEGHFLRRYKSLDVYRAVYFREIKRRLKKKEYLSDDEVMERAAIIWAGGPEGIPAVKKAAGDKPQNIKDFPKSIVILKTILERL